MTLGKQLPSHRAAFAHQPLLPACELGKCGHHARLSRYCVPRASYRKVGAASALVEGLDDGHPFALGSLRSAVVIFTM